MGYSVPHLANPWESFSEGFSSGFGDVTTLLERIKSRRQEQEHYLDRKRREDEKIEEEKRRFENEQKAATGVVDVQRQRLLQELEDMTPEEKARYQPFLSDQTLITSQNYKPLLDRIELEVKDAKAAKSARTTSEKLRTIGERYPKIKDQLDVLLDGSPEGNKAAQQAISDFIKEERASAAEEARMQREERMQSGQFFREQMAREREDRIKDAPNVQAKIERSQDVATGTLEKEIGVETQTAETLRENIANARAQGLDTTQLESRLAAAEKKIADYYQNVRQGGWQGVYDSSMAGLGRFAPLVGTTEPLTAGATGGSMSPEQVGPQQPPSAGNAIEQEILALDAKVQAGTATEEEIDRLLALTAQLKGQ